MDKTATVRVLTVVAQGMSKYANDDVFDDRNPAWVKTRSEIQNMRTPTPWDERVNNTSMSPDQIRRWNEAYQRQVAIPQYKANVSRLNRLYGYEDPRYNTKYAPDPTWSKMLDDIALDHMRRTHGNEFGYDYPIQGGRVTGAEINKYNRLVNMPMAETK